MDVGIGLGGGWGVGNGTRDPGLGSIGVVTSTLTLRTTAFVDSINGRRSSICLLTTLSIMRIVSFRTSRSVVFGSTVRRLFVLGLVYMSVMEPMMEDMPSVMCNSCDMGDRASRGSGSTVLSISVSIDGECGI